jgi:hypothetical protein
VKGECANGQRVDVRKLTAIVTRYREGRIAFAAADVFLRRNGFYLDATSQ